MKIRKISRIIGIMSAMLLLCFAVGCGSEKKTPTPNTPTVPVKLATPVNLKITGTTLTWTTVQNASGYKVDISGTEYDATGATYSLSALSPDEYQLKVMAKGNGTTYTDSNWSAIIPYTPDSPPVDDKYDVPDGISIDLFDGPWLLGAITSDILDAIKEKQQQITAGNGRKYIAYAIADILEYLNGESSMLAGAYAASDNQLRQLESSGFENAYIAIGYLDEDGTLNTSGMPCILPNGSDTSEEDIIQNVASFTVNPLTELNNEYEVPPYISIDVYDGNILETTITAGDLEKIQQKFVHMVTSRSTGGTDDRVYVAYAISDVLAHLNRTLPPFTDILYTASDGYLNPNGNRYERDSFARAYIAIGYLAADGTLTSGGAPRALPDSNAETSDHIIQRVNRITVNPTTDVNEEYEVPPYISIDVYDGIMLKTTITAGDLEQLQQQFVHMVTSRSGGGTDDRIYVAYAISDVLEHLDCTLPAFTSILYTTTDSYLNSAGNQYERDSFAKAYIAIGYLTADGTLNSSGAPRVLPDINAETSDHIIQRVNRITVNIPYEVPPYISIDVYDGNILETTITANDLKKIQQKFVHMVTSRSGGGTDDRMYVAYAISDVLAHLNRTLPPFTKILYTATDGYLNSNGNQYEKTSFARAYIAIGYLAADGTLTSGGAPRVITDSNAETSDHIIQRVDRITVNPTTDENEEYEVPPYISIDVYDGITLKATITAGDLEDLQQKFVHMVTSRSGGGTDDRIYVAYAISDVLTYLDCTLPAFTKILYTASDGYQNSAGNRYERDSFAKAYIAIGYLAAGGILNSGGAPRVLPDINAESSDHIIQRVDRITVNPVE